MEFECLTKEEVNLVLTDMVLINQSIKSVSSCEMVNTEKDEFIGHLILGKIDKKNVIIANENLQKPYMFKELKDCNKVLKLMRVLIKNNK